MRERANRRYRLLVFDWDGTLADSTDIIAEALRGACADIGEPVPDPASARYVIGLGLRDALMHVAPALPPERYPELSEHYRRRFLARDPEIPLFAGARELLDELAAAGYLLAVATGKTRVGLDRAMAASGLAARFHATRCADESRPKPHPEMLLSLCAELAAESQHGMAFGPSPRSTGSATSRRASWSGSCGPSWARAPRSAAARSFS